MDPAGFPQTRSSRPHLKQRSCHRCRPWSTCASPPDREEIQQGVYQDRDDGTETTSCGRPRPAPKDLQPQEASADHQRAVDPGSPNVNTSSCMIHAGGLLKQRAGAVPAQQKPDRSKAATRKPNATITSTSMECGGAASRRVSSGFGLSTWNRSAVCHGPCNSWLAVHPEPALSEGDQRTRWIAAAISGCAVEVFSEEPPPTTSSNGAEVLAP